MLCKIIRWIGYAVTAIAAILIIMSVIGGFCHHGCGHMKAPQEKSCVQHQQSTMDSTKVDTACCKHNAHAMAMMDSSKQKPCCATHENMKSEGCPMMHEGCPMGHHRGNPLLLAISLLLLAIALFSISKNCCCKKYCDCSDGKCDCKEETKA
jgi:hypothetical protein